MKNFDKRSKHSNIIAFLLIMALLTQEGFLPFLQTGALNTQVILADDFSSEEAVSVDEFGPAEGSVQDPSETGSIIELTDDPGADQNSYDHSDAVSPEQATGQTALTTSDGESKLSVYDDTLTDFSEDVILSLRGLKDKEITGYLNRAKQVLSWEEPEFTFIRIYDPVIETIDGVQFRPDAPAIVEIRLWDETTMSDEQKEQFVRQNAGLLDANRQYTSLDEQFLDVRSNFIRQMHLENLHVVSFGTKDEQPETSLEDGVIRFKTDKLYPFVLLMQAEDQVDGSSDFSVGEDPAESRTFEDPETEKILKGMKEGDASEGIEESEAESAEEPEEEQESQTETGSEENGQTVEAEAEAETEEESSQATEEQQLVSSGDSYEISVSYTADAKIPEGSELVLNEIPENDHNYRTLKNRAVSVLDAEADSVLSVTLIDVSIDNEGEMIEPEAEVGVTVQLTEQEDNQALDTQVIAISDTAEVLEASEQAEAYENTVNYETASQTMDTVYAIVTRSLTKELLASDGNTYEVTVTYQSDAGIPAGAELEVKEIRENAPEYETYLNQTADALSTAAGSISYARMLDISIMKDGEKIEIAAPVDVKIQLKDRKDTADEELSVVHFGDEPEVVSSDVQQAGDGDIVRFVADGFSVYVLAYTVDFHWGEYTYSIEGEKEIALGLLLEKLGVTEITLADVVGVSFTNHDYIEIEQTESDWLLKSLAPFSTEETLTLVLTNGLSVEIKVTDAQPNGDGWNEYTISTNALASNTDDKLYWKVEGDCLYIHSDADFKAFDSPSSSRHIDNSWGTGTPTHPWNASNNSIKSVVVTGNMSRIYSGMLRGMRNVESVLIECPNIQSIESGAFQDTGGNTTQPVSIDFSGCTNLTTIKKQAFYNCFKGTWSVSFADCINLTTIQENTFLDQQRWLRYIDFSGCSALSELPSHAFWGGGNGRLMVYGANFQDTPITSIDNIDIHPYDVRTYNLSGTQIQTLTLNDFKALTELHLPATINELNITGQTNKLTTIYYDGSKADWAAKGFTLPASVQTIIYGVVGPKITITADSATQEYDGTALTTEADAYTYTVQVTDDTLDGKLKSGHTLMGVVVSGSQTNVGSSENTASDAIIVDEEGKDVTEEYEIVYVPGTLTVIPKPVIVSATGLTKVYGDPDPTTGSVIGLIGEDTITYTFSRDEGENVGTYTITPSGEAEQGNYIVTYESGTLTITPASVIVKAENKEKTAGQPDPAYTATVTGLKNGDDESVISYTLSRPDYDSAFASGEESGNHTIEVTGEALQGNYVVTFVSGRLNIKKLTIQFYNGDRHLRDARLELNQAIGEVDRLIGAYKANCTFKGWYYTNDEEQLVKVEADSTFTKDTRLDAMFTVTITFSAEDVDSLSETERVIDEGAAIGELPIPEKAGYRFDGWYRDEAFTDPIDASTTFNVHTTVYAKFVRQYTVTFVQETVEADGSTTAALSTHSIDEVANIQTGEYPKLNVGADYALKGWFVGDTRIDDTDYPITADTTVTARVVRQTTVTYKAEAYDTDQTDTGDVNRSVTFPAEPELTNADFEGWYDEGGEKVSTPFAVAQDMTLTAHYTVNVTFVVKNAAGEEVSRNVVTLDKDAAIGSKLLSDPVLAGHEFKGWFVADADENPGTKRVTTGSTFSAHTTVAAKFTRQVTITFLHEDGTRQSFTVDEGEHVALIENPIKSGYRFDGWFEGANRVTNSEGITNAEGTLIDANGNPLPDGETPVRYIVATRDMEMTAHFIEQITVRFLIVHPVNKSSAGTPSLDTHKIITIDKTDAGLAANPFPGNPALSGYQFQGWYGIKRYEGQSKYSDIPEADRDGVFVLDKNIDGIPYVLDENAPVDDNTLFTDSTYVVAKFATKINITFQYESTNKTVECVVGENLYDYTPDEAEKTGYRLVWYKDGSKLATDYEVIEDDDNKVVSAQYIEQVTLTFQVDGQEDQFLTIDKGTSVSSSGEVWPSDPDNQGTAHFIGWYDGDGIKYDENTVITADTALIAKFGYTVTFKAHKDGAEDELVTTREVKAGATLNWLPSAPFWAEHTFKEWRVDATAVDTDYTVNTDVTVTAYYDGIKIYTVTINYVIEGEDTPKDTRILTVDGSTVSDTESMSIRSPESFTISGGTPVYPDMPTIQITPTVLAGADAENKLTITVIYQVSNTSYTIQHMLKNLNGNGYTMIDGASEIKQGVKNAVVVPEPKEFVYAEYERSDSITLDDSNTQIVNVYYARKKFTLSFNTDGGTGVMPITDVYGTSVDFTTEPTKNGYEFKGWYKTKAGADTLMESDKVTSIILEQDTSVYAGWQGVEVNYTIVYMLEQWREDENTWVYDNSKTATGRVGDQVSSSSAPGLNTVPSGYERDTDFTDTITITADGSAVLIVRYKLIRYTFIFDVNDGYQYLNGNYYYYTGTGRIDINGNSYVGTQYRIENVVLGQDISVYWPTVVTCTSNANYTFFAWNLGEVVTKRFAVDTNLIYGADVDNQKIFKVTWQNGGTRYEVEYYLQDADNTNLYTKSEEYSQTVYTGVNPKLINGYSNVETPAGYSGSRYGTITEQVWVEEQTLTETWEDCGSTREYNGYIWTRGKFQYNWNKRNYYYYSTTIEGHYEEQTVSVYFIRYYYNRKTYKIDYYYETELLKTAEGVPFGKNINSSSFDYQPEVPQDKEGYSWGGWYADSAFQTPYVFGVMPSSNLVLYAKWNPVTYTVTFNYNYPGATEPYTTKTVESGKYVLEAITDPERQYYTFDGWYTDSEDGIRYIPASTPITGGITVYAHWLLNKLSYTVKYLEKGTDRELFTEKTVESASFYLGQSRSETAVSITGYLPDENTKSVTLDYTSNVITFYYSPKPAENSYTVKYVLLSDPEISVMAEDEASGFIKLSTGEIVKHVTVSGDTISVTEFAVTPTVETYKDYHPTELTHTLELGTDESSNVITFYYYYNSAKVTVSFVDMEGDEIKSAEEKYYDVGSTVDLNTDLAGYVGFDILVNKVSHDVGETHYFISGLDDLDITIRYQKNMTVRANSASKPYDREALSYAGMYTTVQETTNNVTVTGLKTGHTLTGITLTGSQTNVGVGESMPSEAVITDANGDPVEENFYAITYIAGYLSVTKINVIISVEPDRWTGNIYDGKYKATGFTNGSKAIDDYIIISNDTFKSAYLETIWRGLITALKTAHPDNGDSEHPIFVDQGEIIDTYHIETVDGKDTKVANTKVSGFAMLNEKDTGDYYEPASTFEAALISVLSDLNADSNYNIIYYVRESRLEIQSLPVHIETGSAEKEYDSTALTESKLTVTVGTGENQRSLESTGNDQYELVTGDAVTIKASGSQTTPGTSHNTYTIDWGTVKQTNYSVTEELGSLTVSGRSLIIEAQDAYTAYGSRDTQIAVKVYEAMTVNETDEAGNPVLDENGVPKTHTERGREIPATLTHWTGDNYTLKLNDTEDGYTDNLSLTLRITESGNAVTDIADAVPGSYVVTPDWAEDAEKHYMVEFIPGILTIAVARVSNDGGNTWTYHEYLENSTYNAETDAASKQGAFDYAKTLSGDVMLETLCRNAKITEGDDRYNLNLISGINLISSNGTTSITLRTTQDRKFNTTGFVSTITRGYNGGSLITSSIPLTFDNIILDGQKDMYTANTKGGLINMTDGSLTIGAGAVLQKSASSAFDGGGAIYLINGVLTMNGTIRDCETEGDGGAISLGSDVNATINGSIIGCRAIGGATKDGKTSTGDGGAIKSAGATVTINRSAVISGNSAGSEGKTGKGGGVYSTGSLTINGATISVNSAVEAGGGIYADGSTDSALTISSGSITGNTAKNGGGIATKSKVTSISGGAITDNIASNNGGGIYTMKDSVISITGGNITGNTAKNGGGVYDNEGELDFVNGTITDNTATGNGGGIFVNDKASMTMSGGTINDGTAQNGGGIYANGGTITVSGGDLINNTASVEGGGVYLMGDTHMTLSAGTISGNHAIRGGGIYAGLNAFVANSADPSQEIKLSITGGMIVNNVAESDGTDMNNCGGGIYLADKAGLNMQGGMIRGNTAKIGGGIYAAEDSRNTSDAASQKSDSEKAGPIVIIHSAAGAAIEISGNTATTCGGGIFIGQGILATIEGIRMSDNAATGTTTVQGTALSGYAQNDLLEGSGGAVAAVRKTTVWINNCSIGEAGHPNIAGNDARGGIGGGLCFFSENNWADYASAKAYVSNTSIQYNSAKEGGGVGTVSNSLLTFTDTTIVNNTAQDNGGGMFLRNNGTLSMQGGSISENETINNGGGVYSGISGADRFVLDGVTVSGNVAAYGGGGYTNSITLRNGTQITGNRVKMLNDDRYNIPFISRGGGMYMPEGTLTLGGETKSIKIDGNYAELTDYAISPYASDLRLPEINNTHDNQPNSVKLESYFEGKIRVVNPGLVDSPFGTSENNWLNDIADSTKWANAAIVSEDGSKLFGRIKTGEGGYILYWWQEYVCKITDGAGNLLYKEDGRPALYMRLYEKNNLSNSAFGTLNNGYTLYSIAPTFNENGVQEFAGVEYSGTGYRVEMLTDFELREPVLIGSPRSYTVTFTTAEYNAADGYGFRDSSERNAIITPGHSMANDSDSFMFRSQVEVKLTIEGITLDGGAVFYENSDGSLQRNADGSPRINLSRSFISTKDGMLIQISGTSDVTLGSGAMLQNAITNHPYGGGAVCFGATSGARTMVMKNGSTIRRCCTLVDESRDQEGDHGGYGGAISFYKGYGFRDVLTIEGGVIEECWAEEKGGAIYLPNETDQVIIKGGIIRNCYAPMGGAIYLDDKASGGDYTSNVASTLFIQGSPVFANNYGTYSDYRNYAGATNGKEYVYDDGRIRQDIYVNRFNGTPAGNIVITGNLTSAQGSVWVWANEQDTDDHHYHYADQFAVAYDGVSEDSFLVFRNARTDVDTLNPTESYLTGVPGSSVGESEKVNNITCVYWGPVVEGIDIRFAKIDSNGNPMNGATFTLYKEDGVTVFRKGTDDVKATSQTINVIGEEKSGIVFFEKIPYGVYYMQEKNGEDSGTPEDYRENTNKYIVLVGSSAVTRPDATAGTIWAPDGVLANIEKGDVEPQISRYQSDYGLYTSEQYAIFQIDGDPTSKTYNKAVVDPDIAKYGIMNVSKDDRKVVLKKVDSTNTPLLNAEFEILRYDNTLVSSKDANGNQTTNFTSGTNGVYFIDKLPYGIYYLHETEVPDSVNQNGDEGWWYYLIVHESGIYVSGNDTDHKGGYTSENLAEEAAKKKYEAIKSTQTSDNGSGTGSGS